MLFLATAATAGAGRFGSGGGVVKTLITPPGPPWKRHPRQTRPRSMTVLASSARTDKIDGAAGSCGLPRVAVSICFCKSSTLLPVLSYRPIHVDRVFKVIAA